MEPREKEAGTMKKLTGRQEAFAQSYVLNGGNASKAYRDSYSYRGTSENALNVEAKRTLALPHISLRVEELRLPMIKDSIDTIEQRKEFLTRIIRGEEPDIGMYGQEIRPRLVTRLKASDQLNQMEGVYITKIESKTAQLVELVIVTDPDPRIPAYQGDNGEEAPIVPGRLT